MHMPEDTYFHMSYEWYMSYTEACTCMADDNKCNNPCKSSLIDADGGDDDNKLL